MIVLLSAIRQMDKSDFTDPLRQTAPSYMLAIMPVSKREETHIPRKLNRRCRIYSAFHFLLAH